MSETAPSFFELVKRFGGDGQTQRFISTFCDADFASKEFRNQLGRFTPCFTDVVIISLAHVIMIAACARRLLSMRQAPLRCKLIGLHRVVHTSAICAATLCILIPMFQLNARVAQASTSPLIAGPIAPYEWGGILLAIVSFLLLLVVLVVELSSYIPAQRRLLRLSLVVVAASEVVKLRFVVALTTQVDYFFVLYLVYVSTQLYLALWALLAYPSEANGGLLEDEQGGVRGEYLELPTSAEDQVKGPCPEVHAGLWSRLTFSWISPLLAQGYRHPLQPRDIWPLPPWDRVDGLLFKFITIWYKDPHSHPSLTKACWLLTWRLFLGAAPFKLLNDLSQFAGPLVLTLLLSSVQEGGSAYQGYAYALALLLATVIGLLADNQHFQRVMRAGLHLRSLLSAAVDRKVFLLSPEARSQFSSGRIYNLISSDAETVMNVCQGIFGFVSSPLRIIGAMVLLYKQLGPSSFIAVGAILAVVPVNAWLVKRSATLLRGALTFTDERTKLEGELVAGMDVVKCSTWEGPFDDRIHKARGKELKRLRQVAALQATMSFIVNSVPTLVPVITFWGYLLMGRQLSPATAFSSLALFNVLRFPLFQLPQLVTQITQAQVSIRRLEEFLGAEEVPTATPRLPPARKGDLALHIEGDFGWSTSRAPELTDVKLKVTAGQLVVVVGATGAGKSSLLQAMLGLLTQVHGPPVMVAGQVAYVPQAAFITNATVRDNILFGKDFDPQRYQQAITAACLEPDLEALPAGDSTELGDKGLNISGGQKQRISLARAVYSGADVYLLDDPLSALDARVGRTVFTRCITGVLRGCTVVLVTNQLQYVRHANLVVNMSEGRVVEAGSFEELRAREGGGFANMMKEVQEDDTGDVQESGQEGGVLPVINADDGLAPAHGDVTVDIRAAASAPQPQSSPRSYPDQQRPKAGQLTEEERSAVGSLSLGIISQYIRAMGGGFWFAYLMVGFVMAELLRVMTTVWLSVWTGDSSSSHVHVHHSSNYYMNIYAAISCGQLLLSLVVSLETARLGLVAGQHLHDRMLTSLLRAPMSFFHTTPAGRIINRLTKDTADIDRNLTGTASFALRSSLQLFSTVVLVGTIAPFALPPLVALLGAFYWLYQYYQASVRQVKRMDAVTRSPVFSSVNEGLHGLATICAFRQEEHHMRRHHQLVDQNAVMTLVMTTMNRWLSVHLESLGALATFLAAVVAVEQQGHHPALMGLLLTYALQITTTTSITLRFTSLAENAFNAVERVGEYGDLPSEQKKGPHDPPPQDWPERGEIEFKDVRMRYRPGLPLVLKGVSFHLLSQQKCGVVGRTGAGKSSMIASLFRLTELEGGTVTIDQVNVSRLALKNLRSSMALIPQVPVLFTGSIRSNLSPFGQHSDAELWTALRRAHLSSVVEGWSLGLSEVLQEGGAPLSAGQKQLLALARALLTTSKILVLDEATANVDVETDALIQKTMRDEFSDRTIVAVAHRLHTIIEYDRVLVLAGGQVAEFGSPRELLDNEEGAFSGMVRETGEATERYLRRVARGEEDGREVLEEAAQEALAEMNRRKSDSASMGSPHMVDLSRALCERVVAVRHQLQGLLRQGEGAWGRGQQPSINPEENGIALMEDMARGPEVPLECRSAALTLARALDELAAVSRLANQAAGVYVGWGEPEEEVPLEVTSPVHYPSSSGASFERKSVDLGPSDRGPDGRRYGRSLSLSGCPGPSCRLRSLEEAWTLHRMNSAVDRRGIGGDLSAGGSGGGQGPAN